MRSIAGSIEGATNARVQCTPDLQPTDVTGLSVFNQRERDFEFRVLDCRSTNQAVDLYGDVAVFTHDVCTTTSTSEAEETLLERETIIFRRVADGRWVGVHEHLSPQPEAD